ncbi:ATP-dependent DNA helicase [uncultured Clostridium sp.]|uniref:ATP-dependent DNA helicase n=1 Tax=uncultured Clostridium sp. TaxID=59620 RepID=UPI0026073070|nr:ATP-dependent DNA helicase [uncultured Clostridium sp.]
MKKILIRESVRSLVEFILKSGSIDNRFVTNKRALEGTRAHQKVQKNNEEIYDKYEKEVYLTSEFDLENFVLKVDGRTDGIIVEDGEIIIEEIKSTYKPMDEIKDENETHWAQLKFYAYVYALNNNLEKLKIQLTYYQLDLEKVKIFRREETFLELQQYVFNILEEYKVYFNLLTNYREKRDISIRNLDFPFKEYRKGQLRLARTGYSTIREGETIFVKAPTGIGKTISTLFPAIKAIEGIGRDKIFYLTARGVNGKVAEDTLELLKEKGLYFRSVSIRAKDKICLNEKVSCNPEECLYARGYYEKNKEGIKNFLKMHGHIYSEDIIEISKKLEICPFELSLDLINWCDCIVCDYNYVFDPRVALKRIDEDEDKNRILLIDECHNLVDRGRSMYSANLTKEKVMKLRKAIKGKDELIYKVLGKINDCFITLRKECEEEEQNYFCTEYPPDEIFRHLRRFMSESEENLAKYKNEDFIEDYLEVYFDINKFLSISEIYGEDYVTYVQKIGNDVNLKLFCVDPSKKIGAVLKGTGGNILFSATLTPMNYYMDLLCGKGDIYRLNLESPFDSNNLEIIKKRIDIRYRARERTLPVVCEEIKKFILEERGNYLVFFPSYEYLDMAFSEIKNIDGMTLMVQDQYMSDRDKKRFVEIFENEQNIVGLGVLGGMFSEGIDLPGEKLIGTIVVGVGFPKISIEGEIIKEYFEENGFDYSYIYPGINKVMQAVGRVIRTEKDKGRALLIDDRYFNYKYKNILPKEWYRK